MPARKGVIRRRRSAAFSGELEDIGITHFAVFHNLKAWAKNSRPSGNEPEPNDV